MEKEKAKARLVGSPEPKTDGLSEQHHVPLYAFWINVPKQDEESEREEWEEREAAELQPAVYRFYYLVRCTLSMSPFPAAPGRRERRAPYCSKNLG